jgi:hypothetical protein
VQETNIKCLDFDLKSGQVLYIPAYWFYSVEFLSSLSKEPKEESKISFLASFTFATPMNIVANADAYGYSLFLQTSSSSSSSSSSIIKTIIPFSSSKEKVSEKEEENKEEKEGENTAFDKQTTKEIQEMLSVIETQKKTETQDPVDLALGLGQAK